jgi:gustatory receptor
MTLANPTVAEERKSLKSPILDSLGCLFYVSKAFGAVPYSLSDFVTKRQLQLSSFGSIFCMLSAVAYIVSYHILMTDTMVEKDSDNKIGTLTAVIGIFIIYLEPLMMAIDIVAALVNQQALIEVFDRLHVIDEKLERENVYLNYRAIKRTSIILIVIFFFGEMSIGLVTVFLFEEDITMLETIWWFASCIPLFVNTLAKTWFLVLILLVQQRLRAINGHLDDIKRSFLERKLHHVDRKTLRRDNLFIDSVGYLGREIYSIRGDGGKVNPKGIIKVAPYKGKP